MTCLQLANQIGLFFSSTTVPMPQSGCFIIQLPRRVLRVYWLGYLPGSVCRERVSGASSLVCAGLKTSPRRFVQNMQLPSSLSIVRVHGAIVLVIYCYLLFAFKNVQLDCSLMPTSLNHL